MRAPKPTINIALKQAIVGSKQRTSRKVAKLARMHEVRLSKLIRGLGKVRPDERERLSQVLNRPEHELFPVVG